MSLTPKQCVELLSLLAEFDLRDTVFWRTDGEYAPITMWAICNDVFWWATADMEPIPAEAFADVRKACEDAAAAAKDGEIWGLDLYCARRRGQMPQEPYMKDVPVELRALFEAAAEGAAEER